MFQAATWSQDQAIPVYDGRNAFGGRSVRLSVTLELDPHRMDAVNAGVARAGGRIVPFNKDPEEEAKSIDDCHIFVTKTRSGKAYYNVSLL